MLCLAYYSCTDVFLEYYSIMYKNKNLSIALKETVARLKKEDTPYSWGHFGRCNCGHLAQTVTNRTSKEIHQSASYLGGDWGVRVEQFCPVSRYLIDDIIRQLLTLGLEHQDIAHLENLSDPKILTRSSINGKSLEKNSKSDAIAYLEAMIDYVDN